MAIPGFQDITLPLLRFAADGQVHHLSEARTHLAEVFRLTPDEIDEKLPSGKQSRFANRVAWAKVYLEKVKIFDSPGRGALHGRRARKGVFITTSRFTSDARAYVEHIDPRVVLIDGERLARLMIDHGVGVSTKDTLRVQRVDSDYFADE